MSYKTQQKPVQQAKPRPLTEEEKKMQVMRFLSQKRETFAINILCNMLQGEAFLSDNDGHTVVESALKMADELLERLYPMKEEEKPKEEESDNGNPPKYYGD